MKVNHFLWTFFVISLGSAAASALQFTNYLNDDRAFIVYSYGFLFLFWSFVFIVISLDLFKKDWITKDAQVTRINKNTVWFEMEKGRTVSYLVHDQDKTGRVAINQKVELVITKRTKQLVDIKH